MLTRTRKQFTQQDALHHYFGLETACLTDALSSEINHRVYYILEEYELPEDDVILETEIKSAFLWRFVQFLTDNPNLKPDEVIDSRYLTFERATKFFSLPPTKVLQSPIDDSNRPTTSEIATRLETDQLKKRIAELEAQKNHLQQANIALEQQAIDAMRYRKSKRHRRSFASLDDYIQHEMRTAIREELQVLGLAHV